MSYVFEMDTELGDIFIDNQGTEIIEFAVGYDVTKEEIVLFSITLGPNAHGARDLRFGIRDRHMEKDWKISGLDFSRERVLECIPAAARADVLAFLLEAVARLAANTLSTKITMETYYSKLKTPALAKYAAISKVLNDKGFRTETMFRDDEGIDYWLYVKSGTTP